jgi:hypothetical protein
LKNDDTQIYFVVLKYLKQKNLSPSNPAKYATAAISCFPNGG